MNITYGSIRIFDIQIGKQFLPHVAIKLGNGGRVLQISKVLGPFRHLDHFAIAIALREMADELDRQLV